MNSGNRSLQWSIGFRGKRRTSAMYANLLTVVFPGSMVLLTKPSLLGQQTQIQGTQGHTVVFVCEHGSAKSVIAAAHFNDLAKKDGLPYQAIARGVHPDKAIPIYVKSGLTAEGLEIRDWQPKRFSEEDARRAERVITLGCALPT